MADRGLECGLRLLTYRDCGYILRYEDGSWDSFGWCGLEILTSGGLVGLLTDWFLGGSLNKLSWATELQCRAGGQCCELRREDCRKLGGHGE
jgi:hypothetical protein